VVNKIIKENARDVGVEPPIRLERVSKCYTYITMNRLEGEEPYASFMNLLSDLNFEASKVEGLMHDPESYMDQIIQIARGGAQ